MMKDPPIYSTKPINFCVKSKIHLKRVVSISFEKCLFIRYKISASCVAISINNANIIEMANVLTIVLPCHPRQLNDKTITQMYPFM